MCLYLNKNFRKGTEDFRNSSKILIGYKELIEKDRGRIFVPLYRNFEYRIGENISNRIGLKLFEYEIVDLEVKYGFHFYKNIDYKPSLYSYYKFEIDPKDLIAVGTFCNHESFVATKCKLIGKVEF